MRLYEQIEKFIPWNEQEKNDKEIMLDLLLYSHNTLSRENKTTHFTASAWVLNKERTKVLMIYHNIYDSWSWCGGHADGEENLLRAAVREVMEETGVKEVSPVSNEILSLEIITVNGHERRGEYVSSHLHLNVTYLLEADESQELLIKPDENSGVKWMGIDEAVEASTEPWMQEIYRKLCKKALLYCPPKAD